MAPLDERFRNRDAGVGRPNIHGEVYLEAAIDDVGSPAPPFVVIIKYTLADALNVILS
jgi:hypothetical protein